MGPKEVGDLDRRGPTRRLAAIGRGRTRDKEGLSQAAPGRRVEVRKRHINRPIRADDRVRALILVTCVRAGGATERRTDRRVRTADGHAGGPRRAAIGRLAKEDRVVFPDACPVAALNRVQVTYTLFLFGLPGFASATMNSLSWKILMLLSFATTPSGPGRKVWKGSMASGV